MSESPDRAAPKRRLVILLHGIRTRAEWQYRIRHLLEDELTVVEPIGYGYFNVFQFLCPFVTRRCAVNENESKIRDALKIHRGNYEEVIFVGHSFGTYILGTILSEKPDIEVDRVLLCGSVLSRSYRWDKLPNRPKAVLNEAGSRDIWPILARSVTWGYGSTGTFGFQTPGVRDRFHNFAHSDYFKAGFAEEYWVPWIRDATFKPTSYEIGEHPPTPFFKNLLEVIPVKYGILLLLLLLVAGYCYYQGIHERYPEWSRVLNKENKAPESLSELTNVLEGKVWALEARMDKELEDRRQGYQPQRQFVSLLSREFEPSTLAKSVLKLRQECERDFFLGVFVLVRVGEKLQKVQEEMKFGTEVTFYETNVDGKDRQVRRLLVLIFPTTARGDKALNNDRFYDCLLLELR